MFETMKIYTYNNQCTSLHLLNEGLLLVAIGYEDIAGELELLVGLDHIK